MDFGDFTITKREIIFSIVILAIMLTLGFVIHGCIDHALMIEQQEYNTALRIDKDADMFAYGMKTNVGNSYVRGQLKAVDPVTYEDVKGEYSYIQKVKQRYTQHTRTVTETYTDANGHTQTRTTTETYWSWDRIDSWSKHSKKINFLNSEFSYGTIDFPSSHHIDTIYETGHIRYVYSGAPAKSDVTVYADLRNDTIKVNRTFYDTSIKDAHKMMTSKGGLVVFWILWIILTAGVIFAFVYIDNHWLEDRRRTNR